MTIFITFVLIIIPILEITVFIQAGGAIGIGNTVLLIFLTAILGAWLLRTQGLAALRRAQISFTQQVFPLSEAFEGICLVLAGILLLTPGFLTDFIGFGLFFPPLRSVLRNRLRKILARSDYSSEWDNAGGEKQRPTSTAPIDGKFRDITSENNGDETKN